MTRAKRKLEHIKYALTTGNNGQAGFADIHFVHQSLPDLSLDDVTLNTVIGELYLSSPLFINAMTGGGGAKTQEINEQIAIAARETNTAMAVGSQMGAIKDKSERPSFEIVRKVNPDGIVFANLGSEATVDQAKEAVEMLRADVLQIHLNVIQELTMPEGDRDFKGALERIHAIISSVGVPVIIKETGAGISMETAKKLASVSPFAIDAGGYGGTNFAEIENSRRKRILEYFNEWGIPTAVSVVEITHGAPSIPVLASGGIKGADDILKAISLGASAAGMAGPLLKTLMQDGLDALISEISELKEDMKVMMCALGRPTIQELQMAPVMISGDSFHFLKQRGIDTKKYSQRT
ncbi:type 2 isopentenyl-diphosphate Delta-isomerase [Falsibacillus pallidus]|uniref:Isopentenyl-diphosphate delta-isomerase n=1 Tax=Falsibacillus pallidus TaxID=493781 RepID=A0A370GH40_9BACI|nr:type 2 isopentenyl-diphosphate Delta-isomerase [Falsibacillus pallidus]RDI42977.1 isopentenyl-diphosphate delta-isomerase [Falsibacillus pallidus]